QETSPRLVTYNEGTKRKLRPFLNLSSLEPTSSPGLGMPSAPSSSVVRHLHDGDIATLRTASRAPNDPRAIWAKAFRDVRAETERRAAPLGPEDQVVQSMPDASPTKWH